MKYGDLITVFIIVGFIMSLGYTIGVDLIIWPVTVLLFILMIIFVYTIWIK